jgi:hypothetical protein
MKMLFFSADVSEVDQVSKEFSQAGIACEVRPGSLTQVTPSMPAQAELWIRNDGDCHRALMLCVQLGIGFARRPARAVDLWEEEFEELRLAHAS